MAKRKDDAYEVVKKRTNVIKIFIILAVVLLFGTYVYHKLEGWTYVDSFYFVVSTMTTVGYGDFLPSTEKSRLFTSFYILVGVSMFFYGLFLIGEHFIEERIITLERSIRPSRRVKTQDEVLKEILSDYHKSYKDKIK